MAERVLAYHVIQRGAGMRPQRLAIAQHEIEGAMPGYLWRQLSKGQGQFLDAGHTGMRLGQFLHQPTKCQFAVGAAHRPETGVQPWRIVLQMTVVRKHPVAAPELPYKRVAVLQHHGALGGFSDMGNHVAAFDGVAPDQVGNG